MYFINNEIYVLVNFDNKMVENYWQYILMFLFVFGIGLYE